MKQENIIAIRERSIHEADKAFAEFMHKTEVCFNERSQADKKLYKGITSDELERITVNILKEVAPSTPFDPKKIELIAGHSFPDIMAEKYYGVEVKSTTADKWTSTGSSIVESTRDKYVENIYMMFGKLGSTPPEFRIRPYQDCLSNIAVTHSPRYLIDMELQEKKEKTIFEKLNMPYQQFQSCEDKIEVVRDFYIRQAREERREEMPWWVGKKTIESFEKIETPTIKLFNNLTNEEKMDLKAQMTILFPQVINKDYSEAALWLCTHRYYLCLNLRDFYSAGGQLRRLNGEVLETPFPAVIKKLIDIMPYIKYNINQNKELEYLEFNPELYRASNKLMAWLKQVEIIFSNYTYTCESRGSERINFSELGYDIKELLLNSENYSF